MKLDSIILAAALAAAMGGAALADPPPGVTTPHDNDDYSRLVARAEADDPRVDFHALRFAWLDSAARRRAPFTGDTQRDMLAAAQSSDTAKVRHLAEEILSNDYTDMLAHKYRRQACQLLQDAACEQHEHFVEFGLLRSIVAGGDGRTKTTAWEVAQTSEEYFVLGMSGYRVTEQRLLNDQGRIFDALDAVDGKGQPATFYFDITVMFPKELPDLR